MQPEAPMPEGQAQAGNEPEGGNPMSKALNGANEVLTTVATAVEGSPGAFPEEAVEHLQNAVMEYQSFMKMAMGGAAEAPEAPKGAMGNAPADTAGRKGAVPADMAQMRKGAVPA